MKPRTVAHLVWIVLAVIEAQVVRRMGFAAAVFVGFVFFLGCVAAVLDEEDHW